MKTPELPKDKGSVLADFLAWAKFSKASRITSVIGGRLKESPNGATLVIDRPPLRPSIQSSSNASWVLTTAIVDTDIKWKVSDNRSTITDGTNGNAIDLTLAGFDTPETITETKYIVLEADVLELAATDWIFSAVDLADIEEVGMSGVVSEIMEQNKLRLLIGKITFTDGVASVEQIETRPQILDGGFLNGTLVKILNPFRVHHSEFDVV